MSRLASIVLPASAVLALSAALPAQTTWYVDDDAVPPGNGSVATPYASIQFAIDQASTLDGDTISVAAGTYAELVDFNGKTLRLVAPAGWMDTTIDVTTVLNVDKSCVTLSNGEGSASELDGFTLTGGFGTQELGTYYGGGLLLLGTSPTVRNCRITGNEANFGGGVYSRNGTPRFEDVLFQTNGTSQTFFGAGACFSGGGAELDGCRFIDNTAGSFGAGVSTDGADLSLDGCDFIDNFCGADGTGAYFDGGTLDLDECHFERNYSSDGNGPGIAAVGGADVTVLSSRFLNNTSDNDHTGGAIWVDSGCSLVLLDGEVRDNFSARGGGIASSGALRVERSMIVDNVADSGSSNDGRGGGVWVSSIATGPNVLLDTVIAGNLAAPGLGGGGEGGGIWGPALAENCTVFGNTALGGTATAAGGTGGATLLNTIHRGNSPLPPVLAPSITYSNVEGGAAGVGNIDLDPLFWDPAGPDFHLLAGSPCIDAGDPASPLDPDGSRADMGAFPFEGGYARNYCTAGSSANGCTAELSSSGVASATAASGFVLGASDIDGQRNALFFFGANGRQANPWGNGTSFQCVAPPVQRGPLLNTGGLLGTCTGLLAFDLNARWCPSCPKPGQNPGAGAIVQAQAWYRDPANTSNQTSSLSDAIEFQVQP